MDKRVVGASCPVDEQVSNATQSGNMYVRKLREKYRAGLLVYGFDVRRMKQSIRGMPRFLRDWMDYNRLNNNLSGLSISLRQLQPHLADAYGHAGNLDSEYFYQDWWVARQIYLKNPDRHLDIGSRLDGFIAHLLVFRNVEFVDVRKVEVQIPGLLCTVGDARELWQYQDGSLGSISCLHAIEHVGLGRYGDSVDPLGSWRVAAEICRVVAPGGYVYISTPIGQERLEFNGQRVFAPQSVIEMFSKLQLELFTVIDDEGRLWEKAVPDDYVQARDACGIFVFRRPFC